MPYKLQIDGTSAGTFETEAEAIAVAKALLRANADTEVDLRDMSTGLPAAPGATHNWREELATRVGF